MIPVHKSTLDLTHIHLYHLYSLVVHLVKPSRSKSNVLNGMLIVVLCVLQLTQKLLSHHLHHLHHQMRVILHELANCFWLLQCRYVLARLSIYILVPDWQDRIPFPFPTAPPAWALLSRESIRSTPLLWKLRLVTVPLPMDHMISSPHHSLCLCVYYLQIQQLYWQNVLIHSSCQSKDHLWCTRSPRSSLPSSKKSI